MPNDTYGRIMSRGAFSMPREMKKDSKGVYTTNSGKGKDIALPSKKKSGGALEGIRRVVSDAQRNADEFKRRAGK